MTTIDEEVIEELLEKVGNGAPLRSVCQDDGIPDIVVLQEYMRRNPAVKKRLNDAKLAAKQKIAEDPAFAKNARVNRQNFIKGQSHARTQN